MRDFISQNLKYPKEALEKKVEGLVRLKIEINHKGAVIRSKIESGLGCGCDEEALRLAKMLRFESKSHRNLKVVFHKSINIVFNIREYLKKKNPIQYNYTEQSKKSTPKKKPSGNSSFGYSIDLP